MENGAFALACYLAVPQGDDLLEERLQVVLCMCLINISPRLHNQNVLKVQAVHQDTHDLCLASFQVLLPIREQAARNLLFDASACGRQLENLLRVLRFTVHWFCGPRRNEEQMGCDAISA